MNALEVAILVEILHYEAKNGGLIYKSKLIKNLEEKRFDPVAATLKILEMEMGMKMIYMDLDSGGYDLTAEGKLYVIKNMEKFQVKDDILF